MENLKMTWIEMREGFKAQDHAVWRSIVYVQRGMKGKEDEEEEENVECTIVHKECTVRLRLPTLATAIS